MLITLVVDRLLLPSNPFSLPTLSSTGKLLYAASLFSKCRLSFEISPFIFFLALGFLTMIDGQMEARHRFANSKSSAYSIDPHSPAHPRPPEVLKHQRALRTATQLAIPAIISTLAYFAYRVWCGLARSRNLKSLAGDAWVKWMFLGVEMGFSRKLSL